jgi:DNA-binding LacI/PurR family transcriptional regulator
MREAVIYMNRLGHRNIGYFAVSEALRDPPAMQKYQGYLDGLAACGIALDSEFVYNMMPSELNQIESARQTLVAELPHRRGPTAILAGSDYIAFGLIRGLRDLGVAVPDEVSIMGCENIIFAEYMEPPLTTLTLPKKEKGTLATEMLISMIEHADFKPDARTLLETPIVERESVKRLEAVPEATGGDGPLLPA